MQKYKTSRIYQQIFKIKKNLKIKCEIFLKFDPNHLRVVRKIRIKNKIIILWSRAVFEQL
ncbi:hypothetical protein QV01_09565 [Gallibacterium genomosp. 3]|uniref:Uncharacterized protein n=1 Tax=Gallibacterium genomosp. 3 TaxID=505345 RepID=A0A1A7NNY8_9PAST|nr:hypothetical protein QV01_09565 [Gallibacterium genomosp. 3]